MRQQKQIMIIYIITDIDVLCFAILLFTYQTNHNLLLRTSNSFPVSEWVLSSYFVKPTEEIVLTLIHTSARLVLCAVRIFSARGINFLCFISVTRRYCLFLVKIGRIIVNAITWKSVVRMSKCVLYNICLIL